MGAVGVALSAQGGHSSRKRAEQARHADAGANANGAEAVPFSSISFERAQWLVPARVPVGAVTLVAGVPGVGKSLYTIELAASVSLASRSVLLLSAEDSLSVTVKPRLEAAGADLDHVKTVHLRRDGVEEGLAIPDDLPELNRLVAEHDARLVVIDPLMAHLPNHVNSWRDQSVRRALAPLHHLAESHRCAIVVVVHLNKAQGTDALARIGGSVGIAAAARSVLLFGRDPHDPEGERGSQRVLAHAKCNLGEIAPSLRYQIEDRLVPAGDGGPEIKTARISPLGECAYSAADLLVPNDPAERSAVDDAVEFLWEQLADGEPHSSSAIKQVARRDGHSAATLRRARERLGVEHGRHGWPAKTTWRLPAEVQRNASRVLDGAEASEAADGEHVCTDAHEQRDLSEPSHPSAPSRAHQEQLNTTATMDAAVHRADADDRKPYPGGETALLADLITTFDAEPR